MRRPFLVFLLLFFLPLIGSAQQKTIDSLQQVLPKVSGIDKVNVLNSLSSAYYDYDSESGLEYATQANTHARELKYVAGLRRSTTLQGFYYFTKGDFSKSLEYYDRSNKIVGAEDEHTGYNLVMIGNVHRSLSNYDSAKKYYDSAINLLARLNAPNQLAYAYKNIGRLYLVQWKNHEAEASFKKSLTLYQQIHRKYGIADAQFDLARAAENNSQYALATELNESGCKIASEIGDEFLQTICLINSGELKNRFGDYAEALRLYFEALGALKTKDVSTMLAGLYSNIGDVYRAIGQNDVAIRYYQEALKISEATGTRYEIAKAYSSMASLFKNDNKIDLALDYLNKSLAIRKEINDEFGAATSYNARGLTYLQSKRYKDALDDLDHALVIRRKIGYREGVASTLYNISLVHIEQKQFQKAVEYQVQAVAIEEAVGNKYTMGFSNNRLGSLYTKLGKYTLAENHLRKAERIGIEIKSNSLLMNNSLFWSEYCEARNNKALALTYFKKYTAMRDSLYHDISAQKLAELQALYQIDKKDQEIALLSQEKVNRENEIKLQRARINSQNLILASVITGLVLVTLLAIVTFRYNKRIKKANLEIIEQKEEIQSQSEELLEASETIAEINKKLEVKIEQRTLALSQAYKELDTFFYRSSHDFRRPLTTFLGLAEVAKVTVKDKAALELFDKVRETAVNLDKMLVKLQSISDVGSQQLFYKEVFIKDIFDTVCDNFRDELTRKNIKTSIEVRLQQPFISYPAMIRIIMENLIENAIHFSGVNNPFIKIKVARSGDYITIDFQDNGQGIAKEYQEQVFDMYFRGNERSKGNGLGLYIVKKAVEKLDGSVTLSSIPMVGSTFTIMLPISKPVGGMNPVFKVG
jgi:signal transduction histidine kinase/tetratricopeptide (TPR) repeat protein